MYVCMLYIYIYIYIYIYMYIYMLHFVKWQRNMCGLKNCVFNQRNKHT